MMDRKIFIGTILIILILVFASVIAMGSYFVTGKKVRVNGSIGNNLVTGWSISYQNHEILDDGLFDIALWYYPWETKDIKIVAELTGNGETYTGNTYLAPENNLFDSDSFTVDVHYVPEGTYNGRLTVYEVDKGFIGIFENSIIEKASTTFSVVVN